MRSLARRSLPAALVLSFLLAATAHAAAPTIYVAASGSDSNPCTSASPCKTFDRAYRAASAGSEVLVAAGTYPSQSFNSAPAKATSEKVVVRPAPGATVKLGYLDVSNTDNVEVRDMETDGWSVTDGSAHVILRNLLVYDETDGGYFSGADDVQIIGGEISKIDPGDGIHFNNAYGTNTNITVDGLFMHDLTRNTAPDAHDDCMQTGDVTNLTIRNSRFVNCGTQGVFLNPYNGGATKNITIENNWFGPAQLGYNSLYIGDAVTVTVRNNSFTQGMFISSTSSGVKMIGNILVGMDPYMCQSNASNSDVFDYNMTTDSCSGATHNTVNASLLSQYVSSSSSPASALNLHLKAGAAAIDKGSPTSYPASDYDGQGRPIGGAPDAGADEYGSGGTPPPNAAPDTSISSGPSGSTTATSASFAFSGSDDSTAAGSLTFECSLDSGSFGACTSPKSYSGLTVGSHTFSVRATDGDGATDPSPATATWTVTTSGSASTLLGNENVESHVDWVLAGQAEAWPFTAASSGTADSVSLYVDATSTAQGAELGVYADNNGVPGTLLGKGNLTSPTTGWNTAPLPAFAVTAGAKYWVAVFGTGSGELHFRDHPTGGTCLARLSASNTWTGLPSTWSGTSTTSECPLSAYVTAGSSGGPDTTAPDTTISSAPSGSTTSTTASFSFSGSDNVTPAGSLAFECALDAGAWGACTSPKSYSGLAVGSHTFKVRAKDAAGNADGSPASATWTVTAPDAVAPDTTITSAPSGSTTSTSASFSFTGSDDVTPSGSLTFQCALDAGAYGACTSPKSYSGLAAGSHTFKVRAKDAAGNLDGSPATATWTITPPPDTTAPDTSLTSVPAEPTSSTSASFSFTGSDNVTPSGSLTFECALDAGAFGACTSPKSYGGLAVGSHTFKVRATDAAGNVDASPATYTWTITAPDTTPPDTSITSGPDALTLNTSATFTFTGADAVTPASSLLFSCSLDGGPFQPCTSPATYGNLAVLGHTFSVRAMDAAGNVDPTPATYSWTVLAPTVTDVIDPAPAPEPAPTGPEVTLVAPSEGSTFTSTLSSSADAVTAPDAKISKVEFWIDSSRIATDRNTPYTTQWKAPKSVKLGLHTLSVRAFDSAGRVASIATTVTRVTATAVAARASVSHVRMAKGGKPAKRGASRRGARAGTTSRISATVSTATTADGHTAVEGTGSVDRLAVTLAPCMARSAQRTYRMTLAPRDGRMHGMRRGALCAVRLAPA